METTLHPLRHVHFIWVLHRYDYGRGGQRFALEEPNSPFVTIRNPAGAAKLSSGPKTSVIPKMIVKKRSLFTSKRSHNWWFKESRLPTPGLGLPKVADGLYANQISE